MTRRRMLHLVVASAILPLAELAGNRSYPRYEWSGVLLGGQARLTLAGLHEGEARAAMIACLSEIERLERVFSLFRDDSALSELNRCGRLEHAPADLRRVVAAATRMTHLSGGAFDATVQPLWQALARRAPPDAVRRSRGLIDGSNVEIAGSAIRLPRRGMALTLDGIAQGYIADRVSELLADRGLGHALLDLGEIRTIGGAEDGRPWRVGLRGTSRVLELADRGCATSSGGQPDGSAPMDHILDPRTGQVALRRGSVTVRHRSAMWADAASTALFVVGRETAPALLAATGADEALFADASGRATVVPAA